MKVYFNFNDWYIGYYRGSNYNFFVIMTLVFRWPRNRKHLKENTIVSWVEINRENKRRQAERFIKKNNTLDIGPYSFPIVIDNSLPEDSWYFRKSD